MAELSLPDKGTVSGPADRVQFCRATPLGDVEISPRRIRASAPPARKRLTATVYRRDAR